MHIAVALSGEGSGHATRMTALCRLLSTRHQVTVWCPRHTCALMAPRLPGCRFRELPWVKTVYCGNRVRLLETVRVNIGLFASSGRLVRTLAADLTQLGVDALVCDYEPFMSRAALRARLPSVHFNHQAVVDRHPAVRWDWLIAWLTNRVMMPRSDGRILSSFYNGDVGALLRPEIAGRHEEPADFVVVYARAGFGEYILPAIGRHPETTFRVFPSAEYDFAQSLAACRGVIAPAGHQLTSEALHLRKPLLAFPQENQYEQDLNARMLERSGWGIRGGMDRIEEDVDRFLKLVPFFPLHPEEPGVVFRYDDCTDPATRRLELMLESLKARRRRPRECQSTADLT